MTIPNSTTRVLDTQESDVRSIINGTYCRRLVLRVFAFSLVAAIGPSYENTIAMSDSCSCERKQQ
jgi:hypothetical protein